GAAEVTLAAEDRKQNGGIDTEFLLDRAQRRAVQGVELAGLSGEALDRRLLQVVGRGLNEFGLARRALRPSRNGQIRQREIRLKPARGLIECRARHANRLRLRPQRLKEGLEGRVGEGGGYRTRQEQKSEKEIYSHHPRLLWRHARPRAGHPRLENAESERRGWPEQVRP